MATTMRIHRIIEAGRRISASDIHIMAGLPPMFRVSGEIVAGKGESLSADDIHRMIDELLNDDQRLRVERDWQLCVSQVFGQQGRCRITVYRRNGELELSIRMSELHVRTREELGLPDIVDVLARRPHGLVILTGPTGVGKTTTFHYMIDLINAERAGKVITIEDPIEYVHSLKRSLVVQQEVLVDVHDFTSALRHVLRQDPDVIGVGEMRDPDTIYTALMAAETGHLVIATLHTPGAAEVVQRLVSAFPERQQSEVQFMLASVLQGVVAQQLLPRATSHSLCVCCEVLIGTQAVRRHIRENAAHQLYSEMQAGRKHGMMTMDHALLQLYQRGEITYETAVAMAHHPDSIKRRTS
jgi:twitching motility protein PilT